MGADPLSVSHDRFGPCHVTGKVVLFTLPTPFGGQSCCYAADDASDECKYAGHRARMRCRPIAGMAEFAAALGACPISITGDERIGGNVGRSKAAVTWWPSAEAQRSSWSASPTIAGRWFF